MGYYDQDYQSERDVLAKRELQTKRNGRPWFISFVSAIIGGLLVAMLLPGLAYLNLLPYDIVLREHRSSQEQTSSAQEVGGQTISTDQAVQLNVNSDVIGAVEKASNAIVGIVNIQERSTFFAREMENVESGTGSGVVFDRVGDKAHIVTNYHVIQGAQRVEVSLPNGERVEASLIGGDPLTDLAVLEIDGTHVETVAEFGNSDHIKPGEPAIAIGNPLGLEFSRTVTQGIISAKERSVEVNPGWEVNVIQTDAAINFGNSGGALINIQGQVIGINSMKIAHQGVEGLGFAIPINDVQPIIESLVEHGEVQRSYMGVETIDLASIDSYHWKNTLKLPDGVKHGIVVHRTEPFSPADKAGIQELDVIVEINGEQIQNGVALRKYLYNQTSVGDTIEVKLYRDSLPITVELELAKNEALSE